MASHTKPRVCAATFAATRAAQYALMMIEGAVHLCARCKPKSDPGGFGMHVDYAAKMHARRARRCGQRWNRPKPSGLLRGMTLQAAAS